VSTVRTVSSAGRALVALRGLPAEFRPQPVELSSPHPPQECVERLAKVTTARGTGWLLNPKTAGLPEPRLRGEVGVHAIRVARFRDSVGRNNFVPWLNLKIEPDGRGGAVLTGTVGPWLGASAFVGALTMIWSCMALAGLIAGSATLAATGSARALPVLLVPVFVGAVGVLVLVVCRNSLPRQVSALLLEVIDILGASPSM
jgi:hypothetical protein